VKVSREQAAQNRERILDAAAQLFRERGFEGLGLADLMRTVGLTHGGFYGHFSSKEDLMAQACERAVTRSCEAWSKRVDRSPSDPLRPIARSYLSSRHRDDPGAGCVLAALGSDLARQGPGVRHAVTGGVRRAIDLLARAIPGASARKRQKAIAAYAGWVGAMIMSRAVDDPALSREILDAVLASSTKS
jgi:TetR/AcrR family transcriptional regulator, transcriptional repressor for nem operon